MSYGASRINFLPTAGGALSIVAILILGLKLLGFSMKRSTTMLSVVLVCLVLLASRTHVRAQLETIESWKTQKSFWQALFRQAPSIAEGTQIVLTLPEAYVAPVKFGAPPFAIYWRAFGGAMSLMYGHSSPFALSVVYGQGPEGIRMAGGDLYVPPHPQQMTPQPIPASQTVILNFLEVSGVLEVVSELVTEEGDTISLCQTCISDYSGVPPIWRSLVEN